MTPGTLATSQTLTLAFREPVTFVEFVELPFSARALPPAGAGSRYAD